MTRPYLSPWYPLLVPLAAAAGLALPAAPARAELHANTLVATPSLGDPGPVAFRPLGPTAAPRPADDPLLSQFFHPLGLLLTPAFFPPPDVSFGSAPTDPGTTSTTKITTLDQVVPNIPASQGSSPGTTTNGGDNTNGGGTTGGTNNGGGGHNHPPPVQSPEPATFISGMLGAGLLSWFGWRRRRESAA